MQAVRKAHAGPDPVLAPAVRERLALVLRVLAHPQRLALVELLHRRGPLPVRAVAQALAAAPAATSQHLNQLKRMGLLASDRRGHEVWYRLADPRALTILTCIRRHGGEA